VKYKFSKIVPTAVTQQQMMHANPEENVIMVDKLVLCQEGPPQIHNSIRPLALSVVRHMDHFTIQYNTIICNAHKVEYRTSNLRRGNRDLVLKRPTEDQTEAIHCARLYCSKQLLNDVIFICFTDKNVLTLPTLKNSHNNRLYGPSATKKKDVEVKRFLWARMTFSQWQNWTTLVW